MVGSLNDWQKERQFQTLNEKKDERGVTVIRDGVEMVVDIKQVVVGDIALVEPGEIVPCDGVFLSGHNVKCDESGATGESDAIKKLSYEECIRIRDERLMEDSPAASDVEQAGHEGADGGDVKKARPSGMDLLGHTDCFIISGSKVLEGVGSYVVIAVCTKSFNGRIMMGAFLFCLLRPFVSLNTEFSAADGRGKHSAPAEAQRPGRAHCQGWQSRGLAPILGLDGPVLRPTWHW